MADFKLIPEELPTPGRRVGSLVYRGMLDEFLAMKDVSVRVEYSRRPSTIYISLKRAVKSDPKY